MFGIDDAVIAAGVGAAIGGIGTYMAGSQNVSAARELADKSYDASSEAYRKRYQYTVADMRAAGLNPILAASGGFSVGNAPQMQIPSGQYYGNYASSARDVVEAYTTSKKRELVDVEKDKMISEINLNTQSIQNKIQEIAESRSKQGLMTQQEAALVQQVNESVKKVEVYAQEIYNMGVQADKMKKEMHMITAQAKLYGEQAKTQGVLRSEIKAKTDLFLQEVQVLKERMPQLQREAEIYNGPGGAVLTFLERVIGLVLPWAVAGKAAGVIGKKKYPRITESE